MVGFCSKFHTPYGLYATLTPKMHHVHLDYLLYFQQKAKLSNSAICSERENKGNVQDAMYTQACIIIYDN